MTAVQGGRLTNSRRLLRAADRTELDQEVIGSIHLLSAPRKEAESLVCHVRLAGRAYRLVYERLVFQSGSDVKPLDLDSE